MNVLIWGTGQVWKRVSENGICGTIIGFVETEKKKQEFQNCPVYDIETMPHNYDVIIVANTYSDEIYNACIEKEICIDKVVFLIKGRKTEFNRCISQLETVLGEVNYNNYLAEYGVLENSFFERDMARYNELNTRDSFSIETEYLWPVLSDKFQPAGTINNYFWQDLWAARLIINSGVKEHLDIGSRLDGFIGHLLVSNIAVTVIDVREFPGEIEGVHTIVDDATTLHQIPDASVESLSALCSLEHFGLGRYGDPVDPEACFKCFEQMKKKMKQDGNLYIAVPIGKERVEFNAHRVFYASTIVECFEGLELKEFACAAEGRIEREIGIHKYDEDSHDGEYRYGLFHFVKK